VKNPRIAVVIGCFGDAIIGGSADFDGDLVKRSAACPVEADAGIHQSKDLALLAIHFDLADTNE
jgi:hypothetical protein